MYIINNSLKGFYADVFYPDLFEKPRLPLPHNYQNDNQAIKMIDIYSCVKNTLCSYKFGIQYFSRFAPQFPKRGIYIGLHYLIISNY